MNDVEVGGSRPPGFPASSLKRRIMRLGRKSSDGSLQSSSSTGSSSTSRSAEVVAFRQPCKSRIRRHTNRLSGVFLHGPAHMSTQVRKTSMMVSDAVIEDDPSELSNQLSAPGILKIFGGEICKGAHYKSVLATTHSSAKELVKEALERYGLGKEEVSSYVLCDTIGSIGARQWKTEGFRVVGDNEKPLLIQSLWKPREGFARRFEIQRLSLVEEQTAKEKDTITAGINAQARKLQKSRSRVNSTLMERTISRSQKLWRSKSEMDLIDAETKRDQDKGLGAQRESLNGFPVESYKHPEAGPGLTVSSKFNGELRDKTEALCPSRPRGEQEGEESEREETESSDDNTTQYSIHPPHDCPYLLLLHGCSFVQDFVIYLLMSPRIVIGRQDGQNEHTSKVDFSLLAEDILPKHCSFHRNSTGGPTVLYPFPDAVVIRNGSALNNEVELNPGDVIGLGQSYLFLFKDPLIHKQKEVDSAAIDPSASSVPWLLGYATSAATTSQTKDGILCDTCIDLQGHDMLNSLKRAPPSLKSAEGLFLTLNYQAEDEHCIVKKIIAMGSSGVKDRPPLTVAFLLCMCIQYSSTRLPTSDLRRLLLLIASEIESAVWEQTNELASVQKEILGDKISGLFPLVLWMSNSLEILQFIQYQLPLLLEWRNTEDNEDGREQSEKEGNLDLLGLKLSCLRSACGETIAALEEVIMLTFQQCVYYITKVLYPILPVVLDCNPFMEGPDPPQGTGEDVSVLGGSRLKVPDEIQQVVAVLTETQRLLSDSQLHPEISTQLIGFLFYFINASLFNVLMERGSVPGFYQWSTGMRLWTNLDLLLSWAQTTGLGKLASAHMHTLSSAISLLATPKNRLQQTSWVSLRSDFPALNAAQLNHLLSLYIPPSPTWTPCVRDQADTHNTDDILQTFDTHHPLRLPDGDFQFVLGKAVRYSSLTEQLDKLKVSMFNLSNLQSHGVTATGQHKGIISPTETRNKQENMDTTSVQTIHHCPSSSVSPPSTSSSTQQLDDLSACGALLLSKKLWDLQTREAYTADRRRSALDPSCLLTPPNSPLIIDPVHFPGKDTLMKGASDTHSCFTDVGGHIGDGLVFECLAALKDDHLNPDYTCMKRIFELIEEEEEEAEDMINHFDDNNDEIFSLDIERDESGLGLALVDTRDLPSKVKGIFIRAVVPDTPAARCDKLKSGDRILAVNGVSLLGPHCQNGKELMQSSGDRLRLLVARSDWMSKAVQTEC
ncbi:ras-associating and dilute domain-containing protein isoform X1 [Nerophis ophidion]|uniref:ras-associating and dilute domain-containing protein isoform X1 n=2 Tax=Nerophis ophidion TaxID=159077 RepID=UPI002AE027C2|nr:ras-associating and dilute domain-containing protein isoform X1 [Nerophis ophidion]